MARPTDLTPELGAEIVRVVGEGLPLSKAADFVGISYRTLCRWMKRTDPPYDIFCHALKQAKAAVQLKMVGEIQKGVQNWQSRAWYLERSDPKNWGRKDKLELKKVTDQRKKLAEMSPAERISLHERAIEEERAKLAEMRH
jgi:Homeodomain-like domain